MQMLKNKSLKKKREEKELPAKLEQEITEQEIQNIIQEQAMTDLELDILELKQKLN